MVVIQIQYLASSSNSSIVGVGNNIYNVSKFINNWGEIKLYRTSSNSSVVGGQNNSSNNSNNSIILGGSINILELSYKSSIVGDIEIKYIIVIWLVYFHLIMFLHNHLYL